MLVTAVRGRVTVAKRHRKQISDNGYTINLTSIFGYSFHISICQISTFKKETSDANVGNLIYEKSHAICQCQGKEFCL